MNLGLLARSFFVKSFLLYFVFAIFCFSFVVGVPGVAQVVHAQGLEASSASTPSLVQLPQKHEPELSKIALEQSPSTPLKYAIRRSLESGVSVETIILLILLPIVGLIIAAARHLIGLRGFGIFLPASLSIVFLATGPVVGIGLFLIIVVLSTLFRVFTRRARIQLQYLPRMALTLWVVALGVLGVLFAAPLIGNIGITEVSIFPVLILVLLSEDFTKVQLGKSARVAIALASETLILALVSFTVLSFRAVQIFALTYPEVTLLSSAILALLLGRYTGLRLLELWRFRKLLRR